MPAANRTSRLSAMFDVVKKHYRPVPPADPQRPILEHLLFACCLENTRYEIAEEAFGALLTAFFDYNEMRVSSIRELSEVMAVLPDARSAAFRIKRCLQDVFEAEYSFDLEDCRKGNLGPTVDRLKKINGTGPFTVSYVVQTALGGHSLPVDSGTLGALAVVDLVTERNIQEGAVPGLERAVSKANGPAYGSLLHQLGADFFANPYSKKLHKILLEINPDCRAQLPVRATAKAKEPDKGTVVETAEPPREEPSGKPARKTRKKKPAAAETQAGPETKTPRRTRATKKKTATKKTPKAAEVEPAETEAPAVNPADGAELQTPKAEKKAVKRKKAVPAARKKKPAETATKKTSTKTKKRASAQLSKKKPR